MTRSMSPRSDEQTIKPISKRYSAHDKKMVHTDSKWPITQSKAEDTLRDTNYACQSLEHLPGGFFNFMFCNRLAIPVVDQRKTVVVKMTEDKVKVEKTTGEEFTLNKSRSVSVALSTVLIDRNHTPPVNNGGLANADD